MLRRNTLKPVQRRSPNRTYDQDAPNGVPGDSSCLVAYCLSKIDRHYAVTRGLVAGDRFLDCDRVRHEALQRAGQLTNFRVARNPTGSRLNVGE